MSGARLEKTGGVFVETGLCELVEQLADIVVVLLQAVA
jgi:hypothetical protein